jgi:hypothetical protein
VPLGGGAVVGPKAQEWFHQWGMDLKILSADRDARNESSYRPDGLPTAWRIDAPASLKFAREVWSALEPSPGSRFDTIDRHILRVALESVFKGQTGLEPSGDPARFNQLVSKVVKHQSFSPEIEKQWVEFLRRRAVANDPSIFAFSQQPPEIGKNSHAAVISRAALLLRVASGSTGQLVQASGFTGESVGFWWQALGHGRGLWDGQRDASGLLDLWADIETLLLDIQSFQERHSTADQTFYRVGTELGHGLAALGSCERVAIWSMTP